MNRRELNNLIKEELEAAVRESAIPGHPSYLEEAEDMEAGDMEGGEGEEHEELMDSLKGFYEKLKAVPQRAAFFICTLRLPLAT